jgi:cephalosporin-C deacetylase-like acetyl esterase
MQVWDAVRSLDYLASHPLVDSSRLASTGNSGGGTLTMLLGAVDDRLKAVAISCGNTENHACADFNPPGSTDDAEQNILYGGRVGFDRWDLLYPMAPKPVLFLTSARDFFGTYSPRYISSGWEEYKKLERVYKTLEQSDRLHWIDTPLPHTASYSFRLEVYKWLIRWLQGENRRVSDEPPTRVEEDKTLWVSESGNVVRSFSGETPFTLNRSAAAKVVTPSGKPDLMELLKIDQVNPNARFRSMGVRPSMKGVEIEAVEVQSVPEVWLPAWLFRPRRAASRKPRLLLILEPFGRSVRWKEEDLYQELAAQGISVCAADIRWIGDLRPEYSPGARNHAAWHQDEEQWSWGSLMLGHPMLGQRVTDLLSLVAALRNQPECKGMELSIAARGQLTVPTLCLATLDSSLRHLHLAEGLISFRSIVETLEYQHPFANFVPGLLHHTDLPQLAASLDNCTLTLAGTVDGSGKTLSVSQVKKVYGNIQGLTILPDPNWTVESLALNA